MQKRAIFGGTSLPYLLLLPQLLVVAVFFYWPASQACGSRSCCKTPSALNTSFIWFENYSELFADPGYYHTMGRDGVFAILVAGLSLSIALLLAVQADKSIRGAGLYKTLLIWPYAVAPASRRRAVHLHVPAVARRRRARHDARWAGTGIRC
jgi:sn-glycerol 3-phosphate transport system permease protein